MIKGVGKRSIKILLLLLIPLCGVIIPLFIYLYHPAPLQETDAIIVIEKGARLRDVSTLIASKGIIEHPWLFELYAYVTGHANDIKAGEYLFEEPIAPRVLLSRLVRGQVNVAKVLIVEGWTIHQIANELAKQAFKRHPEYKAEFLKLTQDPVFIESLGLHVKTLEGYLFPNTYSFYPNTLPTDTIRSFVKEFDRAYTQALRGLTSLPAYSQNQIVTMASLIEKESGNKAEQPIIASVFYNRLAKRMRLQSDPTVIYGLKNFNGDITKADLMNHHPYNTYTHDGLPPGPICNPGLSALEAALHPAKTDYIYFVSKGDGTHQFSRTMAEHAAGVKRLLQKQLAPPTDAASPAPQENGEDKKQEAK